MRFTPSILGKLLEPINRRQFAAIVGRHDGDASDKSFRSWDHPVALIFAQSSAADSLRGLEVSWNTNSQHHYPLAPVAVFDETLSLSVNLCAGHNERQGGVLCRAERRKLTEL